jgi:hypothetical protein
MSLDAELLRFVLIKKTAERFWVPTLQTPGAVEEG